MRSPSLDGGGPWRIHACSGTDPVHGSNPWRSGSSGTVPRFTKHGLWYRGRGLVHRTRNRQGGGEIEPLELHESETRHSRVPSPRPSRPGSARSCYYWYHPAPVLHDAKPHAIAAGQDPYAVGHADRRGRHLGSARSGGARTRTEMRWKSRLQPAGRTCPCPGVLQVALPCGRTLSRDQKVFLPGRTVCKVSATMISPSTNRSHLPGLQSCSTSTTAVEAGDPVPTSGLAAAPNRVAPDHADRSRVLGTGGHRSDQPEGSASLGAAAGRCDHCTGHHGLQCPLVGPGGVRCVIAWRESGSLAPIRRTLGGTPGMVLFAAIASYLAIGASVLGVEAIREPDTAGSLRYYVLHFGVLAAAAVGGRAVLERTGVDRLLQGVLLVLIASCAIILASPISARSRRSTALPASLSPDRRFPRSQRRQPGHLHDGGARRGVADQRRSARARLAGPGRRRRRRLGDDGPEQHWSYSAHWPSCSC